MKLIGLSTGTDNQDYVGEVVGDQVRILASKDQFWSAPFDFTSKTPSSDNIHTAVDRAQVAEIPIVPPSARVLCIGLNYYAHAAEGGFAPPEHPTIFGRWTASLSTDNGPVPVPAREAGLDWEGEIAAYVGHTLRQASSEQAHEAILGYSTFNDLTARRAQKLTSQWTLGKNADRSGRMGPLVTADEAGDLRQGLRLQTRVNGAVVQDVCTSQMIFDVASLLAMISQTLTLHPGDVIATGTPEGVGYVRTPPWLLTDGDIVEVEVETLGVLRTAIGSGL